MSGEGNVVKIALVLLVFVLIYYFTYGHHGDFKISASTFPQDLIPMQGDTYLMFPEVPVYAGCWLGSQVLPGELKATEWIRDHTADSDKFVADIGGAETIMGMTTRVSIVGGDWANAPDPVRYMETAGKIYSTADVQLAHELALEQGCDYVSMPNRKLETGMFSGYANATKFDDPRYFQEMYRNDDVTIYRVLP